MHNIFGEIYILVNPQESQGLRFLRLYSSGSLHKNDNVYKERQ